MTCCAAPFCCVPDPDREIRRLNAFAATYDYNRRLFVIKREMTKPKVRVAVLQYWRG